MEPPSPARLYATLVGAALFVAGLVGFFDGLYWLDFLYTGSGALGLLLAGCAARAYALAAGAGFALLAVFGFDERGLLHLGIGMLGLAATAATRGSLRTDTVRREPRGGETSEAGAKAAAEGP
jgi:hypothetical protein